VRIRQKQNWSAAALIVAALVLTGCAGTAVMNQPLAPESLSSDGGPISRGGYHIMEVKGKTAPDVLVLLAFSGGGKRSAAFDYGVLKGMRNFGLTIDGGQTNLLEQVDMVASVSGGSFPAAYYGLYRDKIFTDFEKDFLDQDIESYIWGTYLIPWHLARVISPNYGTNDRMAEVYDDLMFHGATFADLQRNGRPIISINATDVDHAYIFLFVQDQFDLICSNLGSYPVARAVAASNGFPVLFSPITLKSYRSQCGDREPPWLKEHVERDPQSRVNKWIEAARQYLDAERTRYVHLLDGGISDNLAMRSMMYTLNLLTDRSAQKQFDISHVRRILLISADGQKINDAATAREEHFSSVGRILGAVTGTQIDSYNYETMILARNTLDQVRESLRRQRCAQGPVAPGGQPCSDVQTYFVHLSLAGVSDPATRERLNNIPTGLTMDHQDVVALETAGQEGVENSTELAAFRAGLR
jgi:NTE family protein